MESLFRGRDRASPISNRPATVSVNERGVDHLRPGRSPGRPRRLGEQTREGIVAVALSRPHKRPVARHVGDTVFERHNADARLLVSTRPRSRQTLLLVLHTDDEPQVRGG